MLILSWVYDEFELILVWFSLISVYVDILMGCGGGWMLIFGRYGPKWGPKGPGPYLGTKKKNIYIYIVSKFSQKKKKKKKKEEEDLGLPFLFSLGPPPKILNHPTESASPKPM